MARLFALILFVLTMASIVAPAAATARYDARGNATDVGAFTFTYDYSNQPTAVSGGATASYAYDGNLKRVKDFGAGCAQAQEIGPVDRFQEEKAAAAASGGKTVYTVYSKVTGGLVYRDQATDVIKTDYVTVGGAALRLKKTGTGAPVPEYTHFDSQGSAVAATNAAGTSVTWRERYAPFGEELLNPAANNDNTAYTGHLKDDSTGLNYMQARYYDPVIGRFLSTDPIGYQDQLNLYAYVHNDPVNKTDPNGEESACISVGICGLGSPGGDAFAAKAAGVIADFTPGVGDVKGAIEFAQNPTVLGAVGVAVGLIPVAGDALKGALKQADNVGDAARAAPSGPDFVVDSGGQAFPVPAGATGPTPVINPAGNQTGVAFTGGQGGANGQVSTMRIMDATPPRGTSPGYPNGYVKYENASGQGVNPYSGRTESNAQSHHPICTGEEKC